jgi:hypothetical protein
VAAAANRHRKALLAAKPHRRNDVGRAEPTGDDRRRRSIMPFQTARVWS